MSINIIKQVWVFLTHEIYDLINLYLTVLKIWLDVAWSRDLYFPFSLFETKHLSSLKVRLG